MNAEERRSLVEKYRNGADLIEAALARITAEELDRVPPDGGWTPRTVVHHLADSEMTSALRLRRLVAEDNPAITGYDEDLWSKKLFYERPIEGSLQAMRWARATTADILDRMSDADWERSGSHNELGEYGVEIWLRMYVNHAIGHARQIRQAREALAAGHL